jgi:hypothetical protein
MPVTNFCFKNRSFVANNAFDIIDGIEKWLKQRFNNQPMAIINIDIFVVMLNETMDFRKTMTKKHGDDYRGCINTFYVKLSNDMKPEIYVEDIQLDPDEITEYYVTIDPEKMSINDLIGKSETEVDTVESVALFG